MKKRIILLVAFIALTIALVGCKKNEDNKVTNDNKENVQQMGEETKKPLNETYEINNTMTDIQQVLGENSKMVTKDEINEKYKSEVLKTLEKQTIILSEEENYEEITIVKLSDTEQYFEIQKIMNDRYEMLKKEFENDEKMLEILEKPENLKIKIQDNVAIFVISTNADELIELFDGDF